MTSSNVTFVDDFKGKYVSTMKQIAIILAIMMCCGMVQSKAQDPIKWRTTVTMTSKTQGIVKMSATLQDGWHLYGTSLPQGGPKATQFDLSASQGVKLVGQPTPSRMPIKQLDEIFDLELNWWDANVDFTQKFELIDEKTAKIIGTITYMGCNNETCSPPKKEKIEVVVPKYDK